MDFGMASGTRVYNYLKTIYYDTQQNALQKLLNKILLGWMSLVILCYLIASINSTNDSTFFRLGIHDDFIILGYPINTYRRYALIILYCIINCVLRNANHTILSPWLYNNIFDISYTKDKSINALAYSTTTVTSIYSWFDWFINLNILLAQADMLVVEILVDLIISNLLTGYYLTHNNIEEISMKVTHDIEENAVDTLDANGAGRKV